ncbi:MAG: DMT family transporter [Pseudomonadota bacterium]
MLLRQSAPLTVPLVMLLWSQERVSGSAWWPLLVGFLGILVILRPSPAGISLWHLAGVASAFTLSISMVATRHLATSEPPGRILFYYFSLSMACALPFAIEGFVGLPWQAWLAMVYVGVSIYVALLTYTLAYGMAPASAVAPVNYFAVVLAGLWGWLIWGQVPDAWSWIGSSLVIAGGLMTIYQSGSSSRR